MQRNDGRQPQDLRKIKVTKKFTRYADGSVLMECGETRVVCTAMMEEGVPPFLKNSGTGWVTAEYGMLPGSSGTRIRRGNTSGRTHEIQRLIGRSLRAVVDLSGLGERTVRIDCDVLQADGGTRTASITGAFIALALALMKHRKNGFLETVPLKDYVAAVSVGVCGGTPLLDLNYEEDSSADMDMNVVMVGRGSFVEVQGTAEREPFSRRQMDALLALAKAGIDRLIAIQKKELKGLQL